MYATHAINDFEGHRHDGSLIVDLLYTPQSPVEVAAAPKVCDGKWQKGPRIRLDVYSSCAWAAWTAPNARVRCTQASELMIC